jgi:hypothetical protein
MKLKNDVYFKKDQDKIIITKSTESPLYSIAGLEAQIFLAVAEKKSMPAFLKEYALNEDYDEDELLLFAEEFFNELKKLEIIES